MNALRKILSFALVLLVLAGCLSFSAEEEDIALTATERAIIFNAESGEILYAKDASSSFSCGMLPRLMTCLLLLESASDLSEEVTMTREMLSLTPQLSSAELRTGDTLSKEALLSCILVVNSQEACVAAAVTVDGSTAKFLQHMNQRAKELGAQDTVFTTVHGYSPANPGRTTLRDAAKILGALLAHEEVLRLSDVRVARITVNGQSKTLYTKNMLVEPQSQYYNSRATGLAVSTDGLTACAANCFKDGSNVLVSVASGGESLSGLYPDVEALLDYSRNEYEVRTLLDKGASICGVKVLQGKGNDQVLLVAEDSISASVSRHITDEDVRLIIDAPAEMQAPVAQGTVLGTVTVECRGVVCGSTNLVAKTGVELDYFQVYSDQLSAFFSNRILWLVIGGLAVVITVYLFIVYRINHRRPKKDNRKHTGNRLRPGR